MKLIEGGIYGILFAIYANVIIMNRKHYVVLGYVRDDWQSDMKVASSLGRKLEELVNE